MSDLRQPLTASDRPYKAAVPVPKALDILHAEAASGKIDPEVLELFIASRVYERLGLRL